MADTANIAPSFAEVGEGLSAGFGPAAAAAPSAIPTDAGAGGGFFSALSNLFGGGGGGIPTDVTAGYPTGPGGIEMAGGVPIQGDIPRAPTAGGMPAVPPGVTPAAVAGGYSPTIDEEILKWSQYGGQPSAVSTPTIPEGQSPASLLAAAQTGARPLRGLENIGNLYRQSGIPEVLDVGGKVAGIGIPAYGLISQLARQQGGQTPLDPLQQQRLAMAQQQQNVAQQYLTGNVPASVQQNIQAQTQARIEQIRAKYAQLGMSGSTAESQDIAAAQAQGSRDLATASTQMVNAGAAMMNLPAQQFQTLTREQLAQDAAFSDALAKFVASLSAGPAQTKTA